MKIVTSDEIRAIAGVDTRKCMNAVNVPHPVLLITKWTSVRISLYLTYRTAMWKH